MTAVWLFLLVFAMTAGRIQPEGTGGGDNPDGETPRSRKGKEYQGGVASYPQGGKVSVQNDDVILPPPQTFPDVDGLPDDIASLYDEARASFRAQAYTVCDMLCRKILMGVAVGGGPARRRTIRSKEILLSRAGGSIL